MNKKLFVIAIALAVFAAAVGFMAYRPQTIEAKTGGQKFELPAKAVKVAENVYSLGKAYDKKSDSVVEGYAIVHYKGDNAKGGAAKPSGGTVCYGFLAKDAKWKWLEPWVVNPSNTRGLDPNFVFANLAADISKWEAAAAYDILGDGAMTGAVLEADTVALDNQNEVYFADIAESNAIAVTIVWGIFGGPTFNRQLVEWDQIYDDATYDWSADATGMTNKMDFENIATHELGHSVGMGDLYNSGCNQETMYGYAAFGETIKRTLNAGDILGINKLY